MISYTMSLNLWYHSMILLHDIIAWYHIIIYMISLYDIIQHVWYHTMISHMISYLSHSKWAGFQCPASWKLPRPSTTILFAGCRPTLTAGRSTPSPLLRRLPQRPPTPPPTARRRAMMTGSWWWAPTTRQRLILLHPNLPATAGQEPLELTTRMWHHVWYHTCCDIMCDIICDITYVMPYVMSYGHMWYHIVVCRICYHGVMWKNECDITHYVFLCSLWFHMWFHRFWTMISHNCDITLWHHTWHHMWCTATSYDIHLWHHTWYHV